MDSEDEGIFLFGSSKQKIVAVEEIKDTKEDELFAAPDVKDAEPATWEAVPKMRKTTAFDRERAKELIVTGEQIKKWSDIYSRTVLYLLLAHN